MYSVIPAQAGIHAFTGLTCSAILYTCESLDEGIRALQYKPEDKGMDPGLRRDDAI